MRIVKIVSVMSYPKLPKGKRRKFNVYAETKKLCEERLVEKKAEIAEENKNKRGCRVKSRKVTLTLRLSYADESAMVTTVRLGE